MPGKNKGFIGHKLSFIWSIASVVNTVHCPNIHLNLSSAVPGNCKKKAGFFIFIEIYWSRAPFLKKKNHIKIIITAIIIMTDWCYSEGVGWVRKWALTSAPLITRQPMYHHSSSSPSSSSLSSLGPGRPSAGWALVDCREGTVLMVKLLTPRFAPTVLSSEENNYFLTIYIYWHFTVDHHHHDNPNSL